LADIDTKVMADRHRIYGHANINAQYSSAVCEVYCILDERKFQKLKHEVQRDLRRSYWQYVEELITPDETQTANSKRFTKCYLKHA